jgi:hypothetical protein
LPNPDHLITQRTDWLLARQATFQQTVPLWGVGRGAQEHGTLNTTRR